MTSSLVGSEMCIRDSQFPSFVRSSHAIDGTVDHCVMVSRSDDPETRPVSYTHLTLPTICSV
eukprot:8808530-Prorocentrum_lima.AAC.1